MGLTICLEDEEGNVIEQIDDTGNFLKGLLPDPRNDQGTCLRFIDLYGNTTFNHLQMAPFVYEWNELQKKTSSSKEIALTGSILDLALKCQNEEHTYLKFYGD